MPPTPDLIGAAEAAEIIGINRATLTRWVAAEKIKPALRMPGHSGAILFRRGDVERLAEKAAKAS